MRKKLTEEAVETAHGFPIVATLYNDAFDQIVSADEGGSVCVWSSDVVSRQFRFAQAHGTDALTAACFDTSYRRLCTGSETGEICMWNFSNGMRLRYGGGGGHQDDADDVHLSIPKIRFVHQPYD
jgi:WD40 repeat protein